MLIVKSYEFRACDSNICCDLIASELDGYEVISYTTYGVRFFDHTGSVILCHNDISTDQDFVERYIELCISREVSAVHLDDILDDYIAY